MAKDRPPSYTPAPELPTDPALRRRFDTVMAVIAGTTTVTAAAESLEMSRNHFQTILHRAITAVIEAVTPKPAGRPTKPEREAALEVENERLHNELTRVTERLAMLERLMSVVSGIASGTAPLPRSRVKSKKKKSEDPEPATTSSGTMCLPALTSGSKTSESEARAAMTIQEAVGAMSEARIPVALAATVLGVSESTARRRRKRPARTTRRRVTSQPHPSACKNVRAIVRATRGAAGACGLAKTCGVSRRQAAALKRHELREMELERKHRCRHVSVLAPGIIRGFDAMHIRCDEGRVYWLVAADAAIPYRTSVTTVRTYDAAHVIAALATDFETNGPPLVLRLDRIACQRTVELAQLLRRYSVLALHGPPRHPYYYGQLERQNREHRAWHDHLGVVPFSELVAQGVAMTTALNGLWARPTLDWCTAAQAWARRQPVDIDRAELRRDVERRAAEHAHSGYDLLHAQRLAIEASLIERRLVSINSGGWC